MSRATGLSRCTLNRFKEKFVYPLKRREKEKQEKLDAATTEFLERDDNSRMMPGKADFKKCDGEKKQKRHLNDYLHNLYDKFKAENPEICVRRPVFCRRRPKHIITTSFSSRYTCLCQYHQNMCLKLQAIKGYSINVTTNPDTFIRRASRSEEVEEIVKEISAKVKFNQWKRVDVEGKKKTKLVTFEVAKNSFETGFKQDIEKFEGHSE